MNLLCLGAFVLIASANAGAWDAGLERAIQAELGRAKKELKADGYPGIYFAALNVWDIDEWDQTSAMGAVRSEAHIDQRLVLIDMRVGAPALDNHSRAPRAEYQGASLTLANDEFALRHALWRLFDGAYKSATADFLRKQERLVSEGRAEYDTDDLSFEPTHVSSTSRPASVWDRERLRRIDEVLAEPFRHAPALLSAESHANLRRVWTRRRDTNGDIVDKADDTAKIEIEASTLSPDGLRQTVGRDWSARTPQALPSEAEMRLAGRELLADLMDLRVAATTSPFSAPALIDPTVSAALIFALGQRLSGEELRNPMGAQTFRGRIGQRVLSPELNLVDDPSQTHFRGRPLYGHYDFDDQGVPARRVTLVERGELKGFLLSRYPVKEFPHSNGHGRAAIGVTPMGAPGVLFLTTSDPLPREKLFARLRDECRKAGKPFGLWIRNLRTVAQQQSSSAQGSIRFAARVDLVPVDGSKTVRVRDLDLVGTPLVMAASAIAAGDDNVDSDINVAAGAPATVISPSLLLAEAELQRSDSKPEKPPILSPPAAYVPETEKRLRIPPPFLAKGAYIQINRYLLTGREEILPEFEATAVAAWRQTRTPDGLVLDIKIIASNLKTTGEGVRRTDAAVARVAQGGVRRTVLSTMRSLASYRARFSDDWPDGGPR